MILDEIWWGRVPGVIDAYDRMALDGSYGKT